MSLQDVEQTPEYLNARLQEARQRVADLVVMSLRPDQTPEQLELLSQLERSARAEVRLRRKALDYSRQQNSPSSRRALRATPALPIEPETSDSTSSELPKT